MFKKKKEDISKLLELPKFEDIGRDLVDEPKAGVPSYESPFDKPGPKMASFPDPLDDLDLPTREPGFNQPKEGYPERQVANDLDELMPKESHEGLETPFRREEPLRMEEIAPTFKGVNEEVKETIREPVIPDLKKQFKMPKNVGNRPVFVQIDDYKDAMNSIEVLKQKIREVEYILDRLNEIKSQEQLEISNCETSLNKIKEKLISVDKKLFEI
ncbi:hypothetical protein HOF78_02250 [Candidatus Woesearchaeota archaeon]|nr:hypothetical protein [Candidatus Woesearchaeota archaeon]MBT6044866.1 hypothetical protein [Candidatus Woesearchaeota archaeon]